jgi:tetratricopeptide (TPR) repeat protein/peroxiredoxin
MLIPAGISGLPLRFPSGLLPVEPPGQDPEFHLHAHYRQPRPLDALLTKTQAGSDEFVTEKYADQIGAILREWSRSLLRSPAEGGVVVKALSGQFSGISLKPTESTRLRSHAGIVVDRNSFASPDVLGKEAFVREWRELAGTFTKFITVELQITRIETAEAGDVGQRVRTRVRYDLVGSVQDAYREQRVGEWDLEWEPSTGGAFVVHSWRPLNETRARASAPMFVDVTAQAFARAASYSAQLLKGADYWRTVLDGASGIDIYGHNGVAVGDIDGDGYDDLYICQAAGLPNRLYRNRGDGTFEDITNTSGVGVLENTACALFADVDNDGRQDLIVVRTNGPLLFLNQGSGKFCQKENAFQFANPPAGTFTGAAMADYDRDGWLDIYFCLYVYYQGTDQYKYPTPYYDAQNGPPNFMMRNQRDGTFRDVTASAGLNRNNTRYSFCCGWNDFNGDGWPDLYVVNDFGRKNLYRNNGDGTFTDIADEAGVEDTGAGMSVCWLDYDNDGAQDLYVGDMWTAAGNRIATQDIFQKNAPNAVRARYQKHAMGNSLLRNGGKGAFQDRSSATGVGVGRWSWMSDAWDFDHDGFPDLYVLNGMVTSPSHEDLNSFFWRQVVAKSPVTAKPSHEYEQGWSAINELIRADGTWSGYERNVFYANNGDGTFSDVSGVTGMDFLEDGRSFALADFDHDGRLEILVKNRNGPQIRLMKNVMEGLGSSIALRLRGTKSNRDAIGAVVTLEMERGRQSRELQAGSGFLAQHSKDMFFGLGETKAAVNATVRWPSGLVQELRNLPVNHRIWIEEGISPSRFEPFQGFDKRSWTGIADHAKASAGEELPTAIETWLLEPMAAPNFALPDTSGKTVDPVSQRGKFVLLYFWTTERPSWLDELQQLNRSHASWDRSGLQVLAVNFDLQEKGSDRVREIGRKYQLSIPILLGSEDVAAIYNIVYRYLFDRHRDLTLPTAFLVDPNGEIVKVYQGPVDPEHVEKDVREEPKGTQERIAKALPFPGVTTVTDFPRNYLSYGSVFFQRGYLEQADASFRRALRDDLSSAEALYGLGSVYLEQHKTADAQQAFERATKASAAYPDTLPNAWNNLGLLATREGHAAEAIPYFNEALRENPDHLIALTNLGNAYRHERQWEQAKTVLAHAVEVAPGDPEANYALGMVYAQLNDSDHASEYLHQALQARPVYPEALNNLGILYLRTQRRDQAVASFEESIRVAPDFDQSYLNLARVYAIEQHPDKAREVLMELLKRHPDHAVAKKELAELPQ